jgi:hypothetical protein
LKAKTAELQLSEPPNNLPPLITALIGRKDEVQHACTLLQRADGERLLTFTGIGGIGKSIEAAIQYVLDELHQLVFPREEEKKNMPEHIHVVRAHA